MEQDLQGLGVSRHDDKLRLSSVESLGRLIGSLPQLFVVGGLLHKIEDLGSESLVSQGVGLGVNFLGHDDWRLLVLVVVMEIASSQLSSPDGSLLHGLTEESETLQ